jgi:hypothetical protein
MKNGINSNRGAIPPFFSFPLFHPVTAMLIALASACGSAQAADFSAWAHSADFRLNTGGVDLAADVADFPVLIRLDSSNFPFEQVKSDGSDVRFAGPGDEPLALEIERWDAARRRAEVWVRVPLLRARTDTASIRMYWGNPQATQGSDGRAVFDTAAGYAGVWHLQGDRIADAAGANPDGNSLGSTRVDALVAEGRLLKGNNQGITVPSGPGLNPTPPTGPTAITTYSKKGIWKTNTPWCRTSTRSPGSSRAPPAPPC